MKTMTCAQLGGPDSCQFKISAQTFEELAEKSKEHAMDMFQKQDVAHLEAMNKMMELMKNPGDMANWMEERKKQFDNTPED